MSEQPPLQPPGPPPGPPPQSPPPGYPPPGSPPPPFQPAPYQGQPGVLSAATVTNQKAVISLVVALVGGVCCLGIIGGPIAIFFGNAANKEIAASGGTQSGSGLAKAGLIIGIIELILWILAVLSIMGGVLRAFQNTTTG